VKPPFFSPRHSLLTISGGRACRDPRTAKQLQEMNDRERQSTIVERIWWKKIGYLLGLVGNFLAKVDEWKRLLVFVVSLRPCYRIVAHFVQLLHQNSYYGFANCLGCFFTDCFSVDVY
jgi:hypothetical protein